jgi:hypothetical protein
MEVGGSRRTFWMWRVGCGVDVGERRWKGEVGVCDGNADDLASGCRHRFSSFPTFAHALRFRTRRFAIFVLGDHRTRD